MNLIIYPYDGAVSHGPVFLLRRKEVPEYGNRYYH